MKKHSLSSLLPIVPLVLLASCKDPHEYVPVTGGGATAPGAPTIPGLEVISPAPVAAVAPAPKMEPTKPAAVSAPVPVVAATPVPAATVSSEPAPMPAAAPATSSGSMRTVKPEFPSPEFAGTPLPADNTIPNLDKTGKPVTEIQLPEGVDVISKKAVVTSSDPAPFTGDLTLITDGEKNGADGYYVELQAAPQWVQIDLGAEKDVHGVWVWHFHKQAVVYKGVVVGVSNDPEFKNPTFIYNNDYDNSVGLGNGPDLSYTETNHGRWMPVKQGSVKARYVRLYSNGRYIDEMNHYVEIEVYGK